MGCGVDYSTLLHTTELRNLTDLLLPNSGKRKLIDSLLAKKNNSMAENHFHHTRYFLSIETGCDNFCSYCIIPYVRGRVESRLEHSILSEFHNALHNGFKEIVVTGIHIGHYGRDTSTHLSVLLDKMRRFKGIFRIRLSSIEVNEVTNELIEVLKDEHFCRHLHIPLQSGSDFILKKMHRHYNSMLFQKKINKIRTELGNIGLTTDVIVGFPGETDEYFSETYNFIKKIGFTRLHIFPFSSLKGTEAFNMPYKIEESAKKLRVEKLKILNEKLKQQYKAKFINTELSVLSEEVGAGYSGNYIRLHTKKNNLLPNRFLSGIMTAKGDFVIKEEINAVCKHKINW